MRRLVAGFALAALTVSGLGAPAAAATPSLNIVQKLVAMNRETGDFDVLLILVVCPRTQLAIVDALNGPETRTLFAPTDAAFAGAGIDNPLEAARTCATIDPEALAYLLAYHATDGAVRYRDAQRAVGTFLQMLNGEAAEITGTRSRPLIEGAAIVRKDIKASNGLIHVVSSVLIPTCFPVGSPDGLDDTADC
ncbi:MAG: fasciclin domain-containing protein [Chloroflexota bacterium]